jgi:hypothetical protein
MVNAVNVLDNKQVIASTMDGKVCLLRKRNYLRPLPTNHRINPTTNTTTKIPTHTPALKIPPTTSQDDKVIAVTKVKSPNNEYCFMSSSFWGIMQKLCRRMAHPDLPVGRPSSHNPTYLEITTTLNIL